jgi:hypothetical protein
VVGCPRSMRFTILEGAFGALWCLSFPACGGTSTGGGGGGDASRNAGGDGGAAQDAPLDAIGADTIVPVEAAPDQCGAVGTPRCSVGQSCVHPSCCPTCTDVPAGGSCPAGSSLDACPVGGLMKCVTPCTPAPSHCLPLPANCMADPTGCSCLAMSECGRLAGLCSSMGDDLHCASCF